MVVVVAAPVVEVAAWLVEVATADVTGTELVAATELLGEAVVAGAAFEPLHAASTAAEMMATEVA